MPKTTETTAAAIIIGGYQPADKTEARPMSDPDCERCKGTGRVAHGVLCSGCVVDDAAERVVLEDLTAELEEREGDQMVTVSRRGGGVVRLTRHEASTLHAFLDALRKQWGAADRAAHPERYLEGRDYAESNCPS